MGFLRRFGITRPFSQAGRLPNPCPHLLEQATYTFATSARGLPEVRLDLLFTRRAGTVDSGIRPVLLMDRGGSIPPATTGQRAVDSFAATPPYFATAPPAILRPIFAYGSGCDLVFFDNEVSFAGTIRDASAYSAAFHAHPPRGNSSQPITAVMETMQRLGATGGLYMLLFTNGLRGDTLAILRDRFASLVTEENPYRRFLHVIDTGHAISLSEYHELPPECIDPGPTPVHYQHGYLLSSPEKRIDPALVDRVLIQLEHVLIGISNDVTVGEAAPGPGGSTLQRVANRGAARWYDGPIGEVGFLPLHAQLSLEFAKVHPPAVGILIHYFDGQEHQEIPLRVPLPAVAD